jgi:hypothetical protein
MFSRAYKTWHFDGPFCLTSALIPHPIKILFFVGTSQFTEQVKCKTENYMFSRAYKTWHFHSPFCLTSVGEAIAYSNILSCHAHSIVDTENIIVFSLFIEWSDITLFLERLHRSSEMQHDVISELFYF